MVNPSLITLPSGTCNVSARDFTHITIQYDEVCLQVNKLWDIPAAKPTSQFGMVWMRGQGRVYRVRPLKSGEIWGKLPTGFQLHRPQVRTLDEASLHERPAWLDKPSKQVKPACLGLLAGHHGATSTSRFLIARLQRVRSYGRLLLLSTRS